MTHHTTTIVAVYTDAGTTDATFTHWTARCTCGATAHTRRLLTAEQWATRPHPQPVIVPTPADTPEPRSPAAARRAGATPGCRRFDGSSRVGCASATRGALVCDGAGRCAPVPVKGRLGVWNWTPEGGE